MEEGRNKEQQRSSTWDTSSKMSVMRQAVLIAPKSPAAQQGRLSAMRRHTGRSGDHKNSQENRNDSRTEQPRFAMQRSRKIDRHMTTVTLRLGSPYLVVDDDVVLGRHVICDVVVDDET